MPPAEEGVQPWAPTGKSRLAARADASRRPSGSRRLTVLFAERVFLLSVRQIQTHDTPWEEGRSATLLSVTGVCQRLRNVHNFGTRDPHNDPAFRRCTQFPLQ